ncbi:hypothetical protein [Pseudonocardia sp.]
MLRIERATAGTITLTVNDVDHSLDIDHRTTLLDALRERLDLAGIK